VVLAQAERWMAAAVTALLLALRLGWAWLALASWAMTLLCAVWMRVYLRAVAYAR
jgi:hypothetical protein